MIVIKRLSSGYWHIRGVGPCNWAQAERLPETLDTMRASAFPEASETFIREAVAAVQRVQRERAGV